jgi:hypothetical protein
MRGRLALLRGEVQLGRFGRITLTVVFGMLGYLLVPTTPAPRVAHVRILAGKSIGMKNWLTYVDKPSTNRLTRCAELDVCCLALRLNFALILWKLE